MTDSRLVDYYARRAKEYERMYAWTDRQSDLRVLEERVVPEFAGQRVLELACGTGYWTERIAAVAESVLATDVGSEVMQIAQSKSYPPGRVSFARHDAFQPEAIPGDFTAIYAGFWLSHISRSRLEDWLDRIARRIGPGGRIVLIDSRYVEGSSSPISRSDGDGNSYQIRRLEDGSEHEIIKNFLTEEELRRGVGTTGSEVRLHLLTYYWFLCYRVV